VKIIWVYAKGDKTRRLSTSSVGLLLAAIFLFGGFLLVAGGWFGYLSGADEAGGKGMADYGDLQLLLEQQRKELQTLKESGQYHVDALAVQLGRLQARMIRLDALAEQLGEQAGLQDSLDFSGEPALGGLPQGTWTHEIQAAELLQEMAQMERSLADRSWKLDLLEGLLVNRKLQMELLPAGKPIRRGLLTSKFGKRRDPFTGKRDYHRGIDFQARPGTEILAVASGVVKFSGKRSGYGNLVEIRHSNGLMTRYAHNQKNLVSEDEPVLKGQAIALLGSTGRSSGPHVHFEVVRDGVAINPIKYIQNKQ
jgi:murein DD-endopeptidase MepM/ murein hydrolase activator NlpD